MSNQAYWEGYAQACLSQNVDPMQLQHIKSAMVKQSQAMAATGGQAQQAAGGVMDPGMLQQLAARWESLPDEVKMAILGGGGGAALGAGGAGLAGAGPMGMAGGALAGGAAGGAAGMYGPAAMEQMQGMMGGGQA